MKCSPCSNDDCRGRYENRYMCVWSECSCLCNESEEDTNIKGIFSIIGGSTAFVGKF